jgi:catabolite regulation protein CreA
MDFDGEEYDDRVTSDVVEAARDAIFASLLVVRIADRDTFESWRADTDVEVTVLGSPDVERVVWHVAPFADAAVAATFQDERDAAVATLRRQAFGRCYRDRL